jgi:hypothetical protein
MRNRKGQRPHKYRLDHRLTSQERTNENFGHETAARKGVVSAMCSVQSVQYVLASLRVAPV